MHPLRFSSLSLLLVASSLADISTSEKCYTGYGPSTLSSVPSSTKDVRVVVTKTIIRNIHPHTTITPTAHVTDTVTEIITNTDNEPVQTDTATDTISETATITTTLDTVTETSTTTSTTTSTSLGSSLLPTPSGFVPVLDSLPGSQPKSQAQRKRQIDPRAGTLAARSKASDQAAEDFAEERLKNERYPTAVRCFDFKIRTKTIHSIRSRTGVITKTARTSTFRETSTVSSTTTTTVYPPDASTTVTTTITDTLVVTEIPTTTTTNTETATETVAIATSTIHAACDPTTSRNFAAGVNGRAIYYLTILPAQGSVHFFYGPAADEYACCEQCHSVGNCLASDYLSSDTAGSQCHLALSDDGTDQNGHVCASLNNNAPDGLHGQISSNGPQEVIDSVC